MAATIDEITMQYEEDGQELVRELDKVVLSKGSWTTILFRYQDWDKAKNAFSPDRYSIRRYRKSGDTYRQQSKFTISSAAQAKKIAETLMSWAGDQED
ncbi:MAG: hypothetical protein AB1634_12620 [Thermodesulfobacteriota bacterium]